MSKFALQDGEEVLGQTLGEMNCDGVMRPTKLILTNRRVLTIPNEKPSKWLPGGLAQLFAGSADKIRVQIRRDEFGSAEATGARSLKVRNTGEGYGLIWFEVEIMMDRDGWLDRITKWAAGR